MVFQMFWRAMAPLREADKPGMVAFQFPPYFIPKPANFYYLANLPQRLPGASIAIEFRHPSWVRGETRRIETMNFLRSHGLCITLRSTRPKVVRLRLRLSKLLATKSMSAFMARIARTGSNATSRRRHDPNICIRNRSISRLPKGSAIWATRRQARIRDLQRLLSELWNHECQLPGPRFFVARSNSAS